jgi:hypothetical protein
MIISEMKCSMCSHRFEAEMLDQDDPKERDVLGVPLRCPKCNSTMVEKIRVIRRITHRAS